MCHQYLNEYSDKFGKAYKEMENSYQSFRNCSTARCPLETKRYDEWLLKVKSKGLWDVGDAPSIHMTTNYIVKLGTL